MDGNQKPVNSFTKQETGLETYWTIQSNGGCQFMDIQNQVTKSVTHSQCPTDIPPRESSIVPTSSSTA